ncbi:hypothetical protein KGF51_10075 [Clostridioides sp. ZZV14-6045]|uniref:hypothetical protein n=1 Tax=Clostridioides sp. ZZV14-6045 TaxID=2811489 RepID=UPI001D0FAEBD|nr:hypothetical protein [Clostridioides sp. ZZV14-6045]
MLRIAVGEKFPLEIQDGLNIKFNESGFTTIFKLENLSDEEILGFRTGDLRIDVSFLEKIMFFVFTNVSGIGDADIPFTIHLTEFKKMQPVRENEGYLMDLILVEANNNVVKGFRSIGFNTNTSKYIKKCAEEQLSEDFNKGEYINKVVRMQRSYSTKDIKRLSGAYTNFKRS